MASYSKSKDDSKSPNAAGPGFRTPNAFRGSMFGGGSMNNRMPQPKFNPSRFKTQHKG